MYSYAAVLCFLVILTGCEGLFSQGGRLRPQCTNPFKPCRLQVTMSYFNGTFAGQLESDGCRCFGMQDCPSDWSNRDHVISRSLISDTYNMTMNMMFCRAVVPHRPCRMAETSVVLSGTLEIPTTIQSYSCQCSSSQPLQLKQRWIARDHNTYQSYVCANHQPTCPNYISQCMAVRQNSVDYNCKCPRRLKCREDPNANPYSDSTIYGYCRS